MSEPKRKKNGMDVSVTPDTTRPDSDRSVMGAVYTPVELARWVAGLVRDAAEGPVQSVLDPACGDGALLAAAKTEIPTIQQIVGFDMSAQAAQSAAARSELNATVRAANTLLLESGEIPDVEAVIMNPPWGAELETPRATLRERGYSTATGQFDTWGLFIEWSVKALSAGTVVAAILPDAFFLPEHTPVRRMLLDRTQLHTVARLGEGWFPGVFRGVTVVVYIVGGPTVGNVSCIRVAHDARRRILDGTSTLHNEARQAAYATPAAAWHADPNAGMVPTRESHTLNAPLLQASTNWTDLFVVGRGVEMGASGELYRCAQCGWHRGPTRSLTACRACGVHTDWEPVQAIAAEAGEDGEWVPLIVGRDVRRYNAAPSRWLKTGLRGVAYKDAATYAAPKLLVRKTGLGLNAAVDTSGSHTNQVVFHYIPRPFAPDFILDYVAGVLCSKVMLAVHLSRSGETEWRSHPYVTPKVLATLPIIVPTVDTPVWVQAQRIADAVAALRTCNSEDRPQFELEVDSLVAGMYSLDEAGCEWVEEVVAETQTLQAFSHLRLAPQALKAEVA